MTNAEIIFRESSRLLKQGILEGTGKLLTIKMEDGTKQQIPEPEPIHTFATWKQLGYNIKKGEKAVAKFPIWKYTSKTVINEETNKEEETSNCFMKMSAFFKFSQVEKSSDTE